MTVRPLRRRSLDEEIYLALREDIAAGALRPGDPLVEAQLSEQFAVSKTPVREALIRLKRDGLVQSAAHHVNRVATPTAEDVAHAVELRAWIEADVAAAIARTASPELLARLEETIATAESALEREDDAAYVKGIRAFSDVMLETHGNPYVVDVLDRLRGFLGLIARTAREVPGRRERSLQEHRTILEALRAADPAAAQAASHAHMASIQDDFLRGIAQRDHERVEAKGLAGRAKSSRRASQA